MTALRPGTSPPPVRIPMRFLAMASPFGWGTHATYALTHCRRRVDAGFAATRALITNNAPGTLWFPSRFAVRSGQQRGQPEERRKRMRHHISGNLRKIRAQPPFRLETLAKRALRESRAQLRHDTSGDVDAAARPERQRKVAGDRAEHGAEHV